jgi:putative redox protein
MTQAIENSITTTIKRNITFQDEIPLEQKERLLVIASKCPVSKILENKIIINTNV